MRLSFRALPTPPLDQLDQLLRAQLGPLVEQAEEDGEDGADLIQLFEVLDEAGERRFDAHLFCGDDGQVHREGTLERVASFSQGVVTAPGDEALEVALQAAWEAWNG